MGKRKENLFKIEEEKKMCYFSQMSWEDLIVIDRQKMESSLACRVHWMIPDWI
jgi:hypothetical protein